jgi:putative tryptophan/tyrosine transport system substrate-binding protein
MRRRDFITLLGGVAAWPVAARAQQPPMPVIGFLSSASRDDPTSDDVRAFQQGLGETGYVEGQNVVIEYRWAEKHYDRFAPLAADLVRRRVAVIVAFGGVASALAAKAATTTIPIVFSTGGDPVELGLVTSLSRPSGNLTGVTNQGNVLAAKKVQLLRELVPKAQAFAFLANPNNPTAEGDTKDVRVAARLLGQQIHVLHASTPSDIDAAFATFVQQRVGGLIVAADPFLNDRVNQLAALAARYAVPTIKNRPFTVAGGLMGYQPNTADTFRQVGLYTGRILKGAKPADLPVAQSTKFELVINLTTAKALGLTIPPSVLAIADEVIE